MTATNKEAGVQDGTLSHRVNRSVVGTKSLLGFTTYQGTGRARPDQQQMEYVAYLKTAPTSKSRTYTPETHVAAATVYTHTHV